MKKTAAHKQNAFLRNMPAFIHRRRRLFFSFLAGLILIFLLPHSWSWLTRGLTGWNVGVYSYLLVMGWLIANSNPERVRTLAEQEDESGKALVTILSVAAILSLAAIGVETFAAKDLSGDQKILHYVFAIVTVVGSWLLVGVVFTVHYAHMFYRADIKTRPLEFPDKVDEPDYWDFLYFAFTISVATQTADVAIRCSPMRKAVIAQSVLSFFFNAVIIGLSINIAASLIGGK